MTPEQKFIGEPSTKADPIIMVFGNLEVDGLVGKLARNGPALGIIIGTGLGFEPDLREVLWLATGANAVYGLSIGCMEMYSPRALDGVAIMKRVGANLILSTAGAFIAAQITSPDTYTLAYNTTLRVGTPVYDLLMSNLTTAKETLSEIRMEDLPPWVNHTWQIVAALSGVLIGGKLIKRHLQTAIRKPELVAESVPFPTFQTKQIEYLDSLVDTDTESLGLLPKQSDLAVALVRTVFTDKASPFNSTQLTRGQWEGMLTGFRLKHLEESQGKLLTRIDQTRALHKKLQLYTNGNHASPIVLDQVEKYLRQQIVVAFDNIRACDVLANQAHPNSQFAKGLVRADEVLTYMTEIRNRVNGNNNDHNPNGDHSDILTLLTNESYMNSLRREASEISA